MGNKKIRIGILFMLMFLSIMSIYLFKDELLRFARVMIEESDDFKDFFDDLRLKGIIFIIFIQTLQVIITIIPSEPVIMLSAIAYGPLIGGLLCIIGIFVGNQTIYFVSKYGLLHGSSKKKTKKIELEKQIASSNRNPHFLLILLYIIPAISYGIIAIIASNFKMKWWKYTIITTIGSLIPIFIATYLYDNLVSQSPKITIITMCFLIILCILVLIFKERILKRIFVKQTSDIKISSIKSKRPNKLLYKLFYHLNKDKISNVNLNIIDNVDVKKLKEPFIVISNHPSRIDYLYLAKAFYPHRLNFVVDYYMFQIKYLHTILKKLGAIPKKLFQSDPNCVKNMLRIVKKKGNLTFFPEGILSQGGSSEKIQDSTAKFLVKFDIPIILCKLEGSYLTRPKYSDEYQIGQVNLHINYLDIKKDMKLEDLKKLLDEKLYYNDFEFNKVNKIKYIGSKKTLDVDGILYYCPKCHKYYTLRSDSDKLYCKCCDLEVKIDDYYNFIFNDNINYFDNINVWHGYQEKLIFNDIRENNLYKLESNVRLKVFSKRLKLKPEVSCGCGKITLNKDGLRYIGTMFDKDINLLIPIRSLPSMSFKAKVYFEVYYENKYYAFYLENGYQTCNFVQLANCLYKESSKK